MRNSAGHTWDVTVILIFTWLIMAAVPFAAVWIFYPDLTNQAVRATGTLADLLPIVLRL